MSCPDAIYTALAATFQMFQPDVTLIRSMQPGPRPAQPFAVASLQTVRPLGLDETLVENDAYYGGDVLKTVMDAEATVSLQVIGTGALSRLSVVLGLLGLPSFRDALAGTNYSLLRRGPAQDVSVPAATGMEERANADLLFSWATKSTDAAVEFWTEVQGVGEFKGSVADHEVAFTSGSQEA